MTVSNIDDLAVLVAGTEECTWYSKNLISLKQGENGRVFSLVAQKNDLTFGCRKKREEAILKIDKENKPKALLIITTCVLELIGENFESIAASLQSSVNAKLLVVNSMDC